jgi:hypothetical protein
MAKAATAALPATKSTVHLTLQGKGGVGKSYISSNVAQYFKTRGYPVHCIDTDPVNPTFSSYKALGAQYLQVLNGSKIDERNFDQLMERLMTEDGTFVVDNGASSFIPLSNYMLENNAIEMLTEAGRDVYIHTVITGGQSLVETLRGFANLAEQTRTQNIVVWLNEFFGEIVSEDQRSFTEMKAYQNNAEKVKGIVRIPRRNPDTFGKDMELLVAKKLTFDEALNGSEFALMAKQRIKTVQRDVFDQLDKVGF